MAALISKVTQIELANTPNEVQIETRRWRKDEMKSGENLGLKKSKGNMADTR